DLGFVLLAQRQMQTGVDTAALEGLRFRDELPAGAATGPPTESARRAAARQIAPWGYEENFTPDPPGGMQLGAGPGVNFSGGIVLPGTSFRAAETMTPAGSYHPNLQPNLANTNPAGDMLSGAYRDGTAVRHTEQADYTRDDFTAGLGGDAFLVRMRRSNEEF